MEKDNLIDRLEEFIEIDSRLTKNDNWGSPDEDKHGKHLFYIFRHQNDDGSTGWVKVNVYPRTDGSVYRILTKSQEYKDPNEVIEEIKNILQE